MAKTHIRYAKKADVPPALLQFYTPTNAAEPDGEHVWDGFEPDPKGFALTNVGALNTQIAELTRTADRRNTELQKFRKNRADPKSELYSDADIDRLVQIEAQFQAMQGKQVDIDQVRKQVAAELNAQFEQKSSAGKKQFETEKARADFYVQAYQRALKKGIAAAALVGLTPQPGLEDIAVSTFMETIGFEELQPDEAKGRNFVDYEPRVKGENGWRLDGKGQPLSPTDFAKGDFLKQRGSMFKPVKPATSTGIETQPGGGGAGGGGGSGDGKRPGSGQYTHKLTGQTVDAGAYKQAVASTPKGDFLHVLDAQGNFQRAVPGTAG